MTKIGLLCSVCSDHVLWLSSPHLCKGNYLVLCGVAGDKVVKVGDDVEADRAGQIVPVKILNMIMMVVLVRADDHDHSDGGVDADSADFDAADDGDGADYGSSVKADRAGQVVPVKNFNMINMMVLLVLISWS